MPGWEAPAEHSRRKHLNRLRTGAEDGHHRLGRTGRTSHESGLILIGLNCHQPGQGQIKRLADDPNHLVNLRMGDDERRAHDNGVADAAHHQTIFDAQIAHNGAGRAFSSAEELLASPEIDLVHITTPNSSHAELALAARHEIISMTSVAKASHVASALSVVDVLSVLYTGSANISVSNMDNPDRDIVILSKGHSASALYSVLALQGFFSKDWLAQYCNNDAPLGGHVTSKGVPGVELSTGSLGHGLPYGLGIAMSRKKHGAKGRVFVVMSDGECDEGTTWESAMIANHHNLDNLVVIVDRNKIQSLTFTEDTLKLEPFADKTERS